MEKQYTLEEKQQIGKEIGDIFGLRRTRDGRFPTSYGDKTEIGLFEMILVLADKIRDGKEL